MINKIKKIIGGIILIIVLGGITYGCLYVASEPSNTYCSEEEQNQMKSDHDFIEQQYKEK